MLPNMLIVIIYPFRRQQLTAKARFYLTLNYTKIQPSPTTAGSLSSIGPRIQRWDHYTVRTSTVVRSTYERKCFQPARPATTHRETQIAPAETQPTEPVPIWPTPICIIPNFCPSPHRRCSWSWRCRLLGSRRINRRRSQTSLTQPEWTS